VRGELEECVKKNPTDPEAYLMLGDQAFAEGRITDADVLFARAQQLAADFKESAARQRDCQIRANAGEAAVAERREQWELAKNFLTAWLAFYPDTLPAGPDGKAKTPDRASAPAYDRLGRVLFKADSSPNKDIGARLAFQQFKAAVANDDKSISANLALALMYEDEAKTKDKDSKEFEYLRGMAQKCITLAVNNPPEDQATKLATMLAAARWAIDTEQAKEAVEYADDALGVESKSLEAKYLKGVASRLAGDIKTAEQYLNEVYESSPNNFAAANQLAQVLAEQTTEKDKQQRGLEIAQMNNRVNGGDKQNPAQALESAATLGWVLYEMKRPLEAAQVMQQVANTGVISADGLYYIARLNEDQGKTEDAIKLLKAALENGRQFVHRHEAEGMLAKLNKGEDTSAEHGPPPKSKKSNGGTDSGPPPTANPGKTAP